MLVEYGRMEFDFKKGMIICCTCPIMVIEKLSKINQPDLNMIIDKKCRVFVDVPDRLWDEEK